MKKNKIIYISVIMSSVLFPITIFAQPMAIGYLNSFYYVLQMMPAFLFGLSVIYFFWGTGQFILHAGDEKNRADGKNKMVWGIVALTVFASIYGILNLLGALIVFP